MLLPAAAPAEVFLPSDNVRDPAKLGRGETDKSVPFVYLEPHEFCYDLTRPMPFTLHAVNGSGKPVTVDWAVYAAALVLESLGPGQVTPVRAVKSPGSVELVAGGTASVTIDLKERFKIEGASVYLVTFARPLEDGRVQIAGQARFIGEDFAAIDKLAAGIEAGPGARRWQ